MKKLFTTTIFTVLIVCAMAQAPQGISHQAVIRNAANELVISSPIGIKVSILQGSAEGAIVYSETHLPISNVNGLISFVIGQGTIVSGQFAEIDWTAGPYFIKTEADPEGGNNYTITGMTQLLSVPYALHAANGMISMTLEQRDDLQNTQVGMQIFNITSNCLNYYNGTSWFEVCGNCTPMPNQADAGANQYFADETLSTTLQANEPVYSTGTWSTVNGSGCIIDNINDPQSLFTGSPCTEYILKWTISNPCGSTEDLVEVHFSHTPTQANAGLDQLYLSGSWTTLAANIPENGTGLWQIISGAGGSIVNPTVNNSLFLGQSNTVYLLSWTISTGCFSSVDTVMISFGHLPSVITHPVTNLTSFSAICGGEVTYEGGSTVILRGVCWNMSSEPTTSDYFTIDGNGLGSFTSELIQLTPGTTYYVRAYATNSVGTAYGNQYMFTTTVNAVLINEIYSRGNIENPDWIELFNASDIDINIGYYKIYDNGGQTGVKPKKEFPEGTIIPSNGFFVIITDDNDPSGFGLSSAGEEIWLENNSGTIIDAVSFPALETTESYGRLPDGSDNWEVLSVITKGASNNLQFACGLSTISDIHGNIYSTVQIGSQCWMAGNLNIGTMINGTSNQLNNPTIEKYCYDNLESNCDIYGGLYQWDEMMQYTSTPGLQGICPVGWHLPTDAEWTVLTTYVSSQSDFLCNSDTSNIAKSLAATTLWNIHSNTCAVGNNLTANNATGFTGLPGGYRYTDGSFYHVSSYGYWWSSTESSAPYAWYRYLGYDSRIVLRYINAKDWGYSVRCLKDN